MGTVNQEEQLARIADALEGINCHLAEACDRLQGIEDMLDCCIFTNENGSFLRIAGSVETN